MNLAAYQHGNLAVKEAERQYVAKPRREVKPDPSRNVFKLSVFEKLFYILCGVGFMAVLGSLVLINSQMYDVNKQTYETKRSIKETDTTTAELKTKLSALMNPDTLSATGQELGFKQVSDDQKPIHSTENAETASR